MSCSSSSGSLFTVVSTLTLGLLLLSSTSAQAFSQDVQLLANELAKDIVDAGAHRVAVVDFTDIDESITRASRLMADEVTVALVNADSPLEVVDRREVARLVEEIGFGHKGLTSQDQLLELGRMLSAEAIVFGNFSPLGDSVRLSVKALEVESTRSLTARARLLPLSPELEALIYGRSSGARGPGQPLYTEEYGDLEYSVYPCRRDRNRVTCEVEVVARRRGQTFSLSRGVRALDEFGTEHAPWYLEASQGRPRVGSVQAELIKDIPLKLTLIFEDVPVDVTRMALDLESRPMPIHAPKVPVLQ